jgi:glutathione S-transferase
MKLYGSETSPYVRKARILIKEKSLLCEFVLADAWAAGSPVPALNPLGKVPVLEREAADATSLSRGPRTRVPDVPTNTSPIGDDGTVLFDSPVIVEYLDSLKAPALLAAAGEARWTMLRFQALADGVLDAVVARLLESRRPPEQQSAKDIQRQEEKIARALAWTETQVRGDYLMDNHFTLADLVVGVMLDYTDFRYPHDWAARHPKLSRWHQAIRQRPSFVETRAPGMK